MTWLLSRVHLDVIELILNADIDLDKPQMEKSEASLARLSPKQIFVVSHTKLCSGLYCALPGSVHLVTSKDIKTFSNFMNMSPFWYINH